MTEKESVLVTIGTNRRNTQQTNELLKSTAERLSGEPSPTLWIARSHWCCAPRSHARRSPPNSNAMDFNRYGLTAFSNNGSAARSTLMETDRTKISAWESQSRTTPTTLSSEPLPESERSVYCRETTHTKPMADANATRHASSQTDAVGVTKQEGVKRAQSPNNIPTTVEIGAMVPVSRKLKVRKIQVARGGGKEGNTEI